jgi:HPt (histidine-containing phosphotransfer) domain-containing protein
VGTHDEMDKAALEYAESYVDDIGVDGFSKGFIDDYLDEDAIVEFAREDYEYQVRENPESYFNDDDYELTSEQEERIEQLESQIEDLEQQKLELDSDDENYYDYEEDLDNQIEALQEELDNIEVDTEPTEDMIDNMVESLVRDVRRDPIGYLNDYGLPVKEYVDESALAQGLVDSEGWGFMNSYDGNYDSVDIAGETYYVMRIN